MPYRGSYPRATDIKVLRGRYDFAVDGGGTGTIVVSDGQDKIPAGAYILGGFIEVDQAVTSGGAGTVAVQAEAANDIVNAAAVSGAPWSTTGRKSVIPVFTGATTVLTTAARDISIVIGAAALTAGQFDVVLFYVVLGD
jgi:hypothetical protein